MMLTLLNGKTLESAMADFRVYVKAYESKKGKPYHSIEEYTALLDKCFGVSGYRVAYSEFSSMVLPSTQVITSAKASVTVINAEGEVIYTFEGYGTFEVLPNKEGTSYINTSTIGMNTCTGALKSACNGIGAFGIREEGNGNNKKPSDAGNYNSPSPAGQPQNAEPARAATVTETKKFYTTSKLDAYASDRSGKPIYRLVAHEINGKQYSMEKVEIIFYPNQYEGKGIEKLLNNDLSRGSVQALCVSKVSEEKRNKSYAGSYTFKGFAC